MLKKVFKIALHTAVAGGVVYYFLSKRKTHDDCDDSGFVLNNTFEETNSKEEGQDSESLLDAEDTEDAQHTSYINIPTNDE